jgi:hypothetical protein
VRRLPLWMIVVLAGLAALLLVVGWRDRHESGYLPFILGVVWALFVLISLANAARPEEG